MQTCLGVACYALYLRHGCDPCLRLEPEPGRKFVPSPRLAFVVPLFMSKSIRGTPKKKRGRPPTTGRGTQIGMRWQDPELSAIDAWRDAHDVATRPEAIRRLVEIGLSKPSDRPQVLSTSAEGAARAAELAGKTDDRPKRR